MEAEEEVMDAREILVVLVMNEMAGSADVVSTLTALGMTDIIEEARIMSEMEGDELQDPDEVPLDDPDPDELPDDLPDELSGEDDGDGS